MNLMITHVTSLQNTSLGDVSNGLQSSNFGVNMQTYTPSLTSQTKTGVGPFNPGRVNVAGDEFQNGDSAAHHSPGKRGWSPPPSKCVWASVPPCHRSKWCHLA